MSTEGSPDDKVDIKPESKPATPSEAISANEWHEFVIENAQRLGRGLEPISREDWIQGAGDNPKGFVGALRDLAGKFNRRKPSGKMLPDNLTPENDPVFGENPTVQKTPAPVETSVPEDDPALVENPIAQETPAPVENPVPVEDPVVQETPAPENNPTSEEGATAEKGPDTVEAPRRSFVERAREAYGFVSKKTKEIFEKLKLPEEIKVKIGGLFAGVKANVLEHGGLIGSKGIIIISDKLSGDPYEEFEKINLKIKQHGIEITDVGLARQKLKQMHGGEIDPVLESKFAGLEKDHEAKLEELKKKREGIEVSLGAYDVRKGNLERSRQEILGEIIERFDDKLQPHNEELEPIIRRSDELAGLLETTRQRRRELAAQCAQEEQNLQNASSPVEKIGPEFYLAKAKEELAEVNKKLAEYSGSSDKIKERIYRLRGHSRSWQERRDALAKTLKSSEETHGLSDEIDLETRATSGPQMVKMIQRLSYLSGIEKDDGRREILEAKKKEIAERILGEIKEKKGGDKILEKLKGEDVEAVREYGPKPLEELTLEERNTNNKAVMRREEVVKFIKNKYSIKQDEDAIDLYEALARYNRPAEVEPVKKEGAKEGGGDKTKILKERERLIVEQIAVLQKTFDELQKALDEIRTELNPSAKPEPPEGIAIKEEDGEKREEGEKEMTPRQYVKAWNIYVPDEYKIDEKKFLSERSDGASKRSIDEIEDSVRSLFNRGEKKNTRRRRSREFKQGLEDAMGEVRKSL
jgi:hypothetical protein